MDEHGHQNGPLTPTSVEMAKQFEEVKPMFKNDDHGPVRAPPTTAATPTPEVAFNEKLPIHKTVEELQHFVNEMETTDEDPENSEQPATNRVFKLVLTGGPCGGKTTAVVHLTTFFASRGWLVYNVPETATVLLGGGVKFEELLEIQAWKFQKNLLLVLLAVEQTFFDLAEPPENRNVVIICDRGAMDPSAYMDPEGWQQVLRECNLDQFALRDDRYNQVIHLVTAADGAEQFYTLANNATRTEGIEEAKQQDKKTQQAWIGHPYFDIIDNSISGGFGGKIQRLLEAVCDRAGLPVPEKNSKKRKWLVRAVDCGHQEFGVSHDYLLSDNPDVETRIRSRTQNGQTTFTMTLRHLVENQQIETRTKISHREYMRFFATKDKSRATVHKTRQCFSYSNRYYNLDTYIEPLPPFVAASTMILESFTAAEDSFELPPFLSIEREITNDLNYRMYHMARCSDPMHASSSKDLGSASVCDE